STPPPIPPHAGSGHLGQHAPSACSVPSHSPTILPRHHGLPLVTIPPAGCVATSLVASVDSTDRESRRGRQPVATRSNTNEDHVLQTPGSWDAHPRDDDAL